MDVVRSSAEPKLRPTLSGRDYWRPEPYELERDRVFGAGWVCVGREEHLPEPGSYLTRELLGEPVFAIRGTEGSIRAFANACRHRGTRLLDGEGHTGTVVKCPYHAWTYGLDGGLLGTPNVREQDGLDRSRFGLWEIPLDRHDGFVFVNLDGSAPPLLEHLGSAPENLLQLERYRLAELRVGARVEYDVAANWKIVVENYHECLHCPSVHPELVKIVPLYRTGQVEEDGQMLGNSMGHGLTSFTSSGISSLPTLPGLTEEDVHTFYGVYVFPNLIVNYHSDTVNAVTLYPAGPGRTTVVSEYLFDPVAMAAGGFDPSEVVAFRDLVARQDWVVCELAQRGVRSRFYTEGVYPPHEKYLALFNDRYLAARGPLDPA